MSFNPTLPAANSEMHSEEMRNQFNGLKDLIDENIPASEKGAANGVASLDGSGNLVQPANFNTLANKPTPVADGTYTVGIGATQNGTITVVGGIITAVQEASGAVPVLVARVSGAGTPEWNGDYAYAGQVGGKPSFKKDASHAVWWLPVGVSQWQFSPAPGVPMGTAYRSVQDVVNPWDVTSWIVEPGSSAPAPSVALTLA